MSDDQLDTQADTQPAHADVTPEPDWNSVAQASTEAQAAPEPTPAPAADEGIRRTGKTVKKVVRTKFSPEILFARVQEMGRAQTHADETKDDAKQAAASAKSARKRFEQLATECASGEGDVEVDCELVFVFANNTAEYRRIDTGDVLDRRAMTQVERQPELFDTRPNGDVVEKATGVVVESAQETEEAEDEDAPVDSDDASEGEDEDGSDEGDAPESDDVPEISDPEALLANEAPTPKMKAKRTRRAKAKA